MACHSMKRLTTALPRLPDDYSEWAPHDLKLSWPGRRRLGVNEAGLLPG